MRFRLPKEALIYLAIMVAIDVVAFGIAVYHQTHQHKTVGWSPGSSDVSGKAPAKSSGAASDSTQYVAKSAAVSGWVIFALLVGATVAYAWLRREEVEDGEVIQGLPPEQY